MAPSRHPLDADCKNCWRLHEQLATDNAFDFGQDHLRLRAFNNPPALTSGVFGAGRRCGRVVGGGASSHYLWIDGNSPRFRADQLTLSAYVCIEDFTTVSTYPRRLAWKALSGSTASYALWLNGTDGIEARVVLGPVAETVSAVASGIVTGSHLITMTWDQTTLRLYVDGEEAATGTSPLGQTAITYNTWGFYVGSGGAQAGANGFCGWMDEIALYGVAKSAAWIASVYDGTVAAWEGAVPSGMSLPLTGDCVGRWLLEETSSTDQAADTGPSGYHLDSDEDWGDYALPIDSSVAGSVSRHCAGAGFVHTAATALRALDSFTLAAWIWPVSHSGDTYRRSVIYAPRSYTSWAPMYAIYGKPPPDEHYYGVTIRGGIDGASGADLDAGFDVAVDPYTWHLLVGTFDATAMLLRFYIDGEMTDEVSTAPYNSIDHTTNTADFFLASTNDNHAVLAGLLDEAAVYSTAKSAEWVASVYDAAPSGLFALSAVSLEYAPLGIARKAVPMESGATLAAADSRFALSGVTLEYRPEGIARKAVPMDSGATLAAADGLLSLSGVTLEYAPIGRLRGLGAARSGS